MKNFFNFSFYTFSYTFSYASLFSLKNYYACSGSAIGLNPNGIKVIAVDGKSIEFWYSGSGTKLQLRKTQKQKAMLKDRIEKGDLITDYFSYGSEQAIVRFVIKREDPKRVKIIITQKKRVLEQVPGMADVKISKNQLWKIRFQ